MPDGGAAEEVRAAGAIVWRPAGRGAQVALIHRPKYDDWSFPKGKLLDGEHVLLAATREVAEETGLVVTLGRRLPPERYDVAIPKRVDYWTATVGSASAGFSPTAEVDELAWVAASAAGRRLSYPRDMQTLASFRAGPLHTVPLILVRHASAGNKSRWRKDDRSRPLDARGKKDASMLAALLRCFGTGRVVSSPAERCIATVRPYAALAGTEVEVEVEPALEMAKKAAAADPEAAKAIAVLAGADEPVVVCAHRENMPFLLDAACAELGADCPSVKPLRKGEFMVLHRADGKLAAIERYHPGGGS